MHLSPFSQCRSSCVSNLPQRSTCPMKRALVLPISLGVLAAACAVLWPACRLQMHVHSFVCCSACGGQSCSARQLRASELARNQLAPSTSFRRTAAAGRRRRIGWKHKTQLLDCAGVWRPTATPRQAARRCLAHEVGDDACCWVPACPVPGAGCGWTAGSAGIDGRLIASVRVEANRNNEPKGCRVR